MTTSTSSKNYAGALQELAKENIMTYDDIRTDLNTVKQVVASSYDLKNVLANITIPTDVKNSIIDDVFKTLVNTKIINFLKILTNKNKFNEFYEVQAAFETIYNDFKGIKPVSITSAIVLDEEQKSKIINKLQTKLNKQVIAEWILDESIIGGLIIKIDDNVINSSLKNKLEKLI